MRSAQFASSPRSWLTSSTVSGVDASRRSAPTLARDVEVVVGLVEQQDVGRAPQQGLKHQPLLLASGQGANLAPAAALVAHPERGHAAGIPHHLGVIAARVAPFGQRRRVPHLDGLVVAFHHRQFGTIQPGRGGLHPGRGDRDQQVADWEAPVTRPVSSWLDATPAESGAAATPLASSEPGPWKAAAPPRPAAPGGVLRIPPTNCLITPRPPLMAIVPDWGEMSPAMSLISVVLPAPFGPTRAACPSRPGTTRRRAAPCRWEGRGPGVPHRRDPRWSFSQMRSFGCWLTVTWLPPADR